MKVPEHLSGICAEILATEAQTAEHKSLWAVILGLTPYRDGNQWCVLYGEDIQSGIAGFGDSPIDAMYNFDTSMYEKIKHHDPH